MSGAPASLAAAALAALLGAGAALTQIGTAPAWAGQPLAAPVLPLAAIAGWGSVRGPGEAAAAAIAAAASLGAASEERAGWFLLAMLPAVALVAPASALRPRARPLIAPAAAALGAVGYQGLLHLSGGAAEALAGGGGALLRGAFWSACAALPLAAACQAFRWAAGPRPAVRGLFG